MELVPIYWAKETIHRKASLCRQGLGPNVNSSEIRRAFVDCRVPGVGSQQRWSKCGKRKQITRVSFPHWVAPVLEVVHPPAHGGGSQVRHVMFSVVATVLDPG